MQKLYKMKSGLLLLLAPVSEEEYLKTSEYSKGKSWKEYLKENSLHDPSSIKMDDVEKVLFKQSHDLDDCITYLEHEVTLSLAQTMMSLEQARNHPDEKRLIHKYEFRMDKYNNMSVLVEKIKLLATAIKKHTIFGG